MPQRTVPEATAVQTMRAVSSVEEVQQIPKARSSVEQVREAAKDISASLAAIPSDLQFEVDDDAGEVIVRMINRHTKEVIRQIPSETALELAKSLNNLAGRLVSAKV
jgi:flagellar protein FlaG